MATGLKNWSTTAADNDDADSTINWQEGQAPSTVNNSGRSMMAVLAADAVRSEDTDITPVTVVSTTTETTVYSYSVPANTLGTNRMIRLTAIVSYQTTLNENITLTLTYGSTDVGYMNLSSNTARTFVVEMYLVATGATGTQRGGFTAQNSSTAHGTATENSTTALNLVLTAQPSVNSANDTITVHVVQTEVI